jgi:hypothetical protein
LDAGDLFPGFIVGAHLNDCPLVQLLSQNPNSLETLANDLLWIHHKFLKRTEEHEKSDAIPGCDFFINLAPDSLFLR